MRSSRRPLVIVLAAAGLVAWLVAVATLVVTPARADETPGETTSTTTPTQSPTESESPSPSESVTESPSETASESPSESESPTASETPGSTETLTHVALRWGVNTESNTAAFSPGTYNFLAAGAIPDPGRGGHEVTEAEWRQRAGNVEIEKCDASTGAWVDATWAGLRTDTAGRPLVTGRSSGHEMVFEAGTGVIDRERGTLHLEWKGTITLVAYSGLSFFYLSDPVLDVADGRGTVTATLSGYGSAMDDQTKWVQIAPRSVTAADLPSVSLGADGFVGQPAYAGVTVDGGAVPQRTDEAGWGSFPESWVDFMQDLGTASFWYSSGGAADSNKPPTPLSVSFSARRSACVPPPAASEAPAIRNTAPPPPKTTSAAPPAAGSGSGAQAAPTLPVPPALPVPASAEQALTRPATDLRLAASNSGPGPDSRSWPWWGGGALLLLAAAALSLPRAPSRP